MDLQDATERVTVGTVVRAVPVTVIVVTLISGYLAANGIRYGEVFRITLLNPLVYVVNMLFHSDWGHYAGNLRIWVPLGVALTWLTSDRHVLGLVVTSQVLVTVVSLSIGRYGVGLSVAALAVAAATLVRATGLAMEEASTDGLQVVLAAVFGPLVVGFLLVTLLAGANTDIGHLEHFVGFCFGGAIEAMYVFSDHDTDDSGRRIPERIGR